MRFLCTVTARLVCLLFVVGGCARVTTGGGRDRGASPSTDLTARDGELDGPRAGEMGAVVDGSGDSVRGDATSESVPKLDGFTDAVSGWLAAPSSWSFSHLQSAGPGLLVVVVARGDVSIPSATYGGASMQRLDERRLTAPGAQSSFALFHLASPAAGLANVVIGFGMSGLRGVGAWALEVSDYDTSDPLGASVVGSANWSKDFSLALSPVLANSLVFVSFVHRPINSTNIAIARPLSRLSFLRGSDDNGIAAALGFVSKPPLGANSYSGISSGTDYSFEWAFEIKPRP